MQAPAAVSFAVAAQLVRRCAACATLRNGETAAVRLTPECLHPLLHIVRASPAALRGVLPVLHPFVHLTSSGWIRLGTDDQKGRLSMSPEAECSHPPTRLLVDMQGRNVSTSDSTGRVGVILIDLPSCALLFLAVVILLIHPSCACPGPDRRGSCSVVHEKVRRRTLCHITRCQGYRLVPPRKSVGRRFT